MKKVVLRLRLTQPTATAPLAARGESTINLIDRETVIPAQAGMTTRFNHSQTGQIEAKQKMIEMDKSFRYYWHHIAYHTDSVVGGTNLFKSASFNPYRTL
ncbi:hypothetical protein [Conchiformibius kuhniae]|uniref:Uncharacterized protein n=1 Tax=Conchiformibius kuhniae TaxID=211502 RepID=A0A8T9MWI9_9NEIS|nr:hypothetical protein [Conchiformibius kuhniae]UOP04798.1 hypothetical protein LVJ77_11735 [Conchiformibius kuhniae]